MAIVSTDRFYTTDLLYSNIRALLSTYPFLQSEIIGYSVLGNPIPYIRIGRGSNRVFYSASIHANESITTNVLLKFIEDFKPDMCGIGPFIPHKDTIFKKEKAGSVELTCYLLSLIRLIYPSVLLPATTALGTLNERGREKGILAGANVVMPNLSPLSVRKKYELYDNKISTGQESAQGLQKLKARMKDISYEVVCERGDIIRKV